MNNAIPDRDDHVKLGHELDLFVTDPVIGKGLPLLTPRGATLKRVLTRFIKDEELSTRVRVHRNSGNCLQ